MKILIFLSILLGFLLTNSELSQGANLSIRKSGPSIANPGDLVTYTITYSNTASTLEDHVVITDYLPDASNCTYYSSFPSGVYNSDLNTLTWNSTQIPVLASLDAGSGENTIQVTLRVGKLGTGINLSGAGYYLSTSSVTLNSYAEIKSDQTTTSVLSDPVPTIVSYNCSFKISQPGAGIKSATGSTLTYLVALTNTGNIYQKYSLNSSLFSGQHLEQYIQDLNGVAISGTPFVAPGGTYFFHYVLQTPEKDGTNPNQFTETKINATPNLCGNPQEAIYSTFIYGGSYSKYELLSVYKIDTSDPVQSGSQLTYQIVISNVGDPLDNVRLTEAYPDNTTFLSASTSVPAVTTGNNIWDFATLPTGNTIVTVTLDVANGLPNGTILNNTVEVSSGGKTYDTYTEQTTVASAPDLAITKTATVVDSPAGPGSTVNYTLTYTNYGNYPASGIVIKDNYDETYMQVGNIGSGINAGGEITWNIPGPLIPGDSKFIHYSMTIKDDVLLFLKGSTNIINKALISSNLADRNISNNTATATVNVLVLPDLKIEKTADPAIGVVNQPITYTLSVSNKGKVGHIGGTYSVVDYLPAGTTYLSSTPSGGIYNDGTVSWTISEDLPFNETKNFTVTLSALPCSLVGSGTLVNKAAVNSGMYGDADNSNNEDLLITDVVDLENPTIPSLEPVSVNNDPGKCSAEVTLTVPIAGDNCEFLSVTNDHPSTTFPLGTTTVKWSATDIHGNVTTTNQNVIVNDVSAPVADVAILPTITGECSASVLAAPTATDNCKGPITGTTEDPAEYTQQGSYTIHWTYDDGNGNTSTQAQTVVVKDLSAPVADVAILPTITGECSVLVTAPTASDNCKGPIVGTTEDPTEYTQQGSYTIHWKYDDGYGNTSTQTQTVVVKDNTSPEMPVLADVIVGECSGTPDTPTTTDNCLEPVTGTTTTEFPITTQGITVVEWSFDDGHGNKITALQNVVVDDTTDPVADVQTLPILTGECSVIVPVPTATDNCEGVIEGTTEDALIYSAQGTYTIDWTYDDGNGNISTQTQTVLVDDVTAPVPDIAVLPTLTGKYILIAPFPTATDNCSGLIIGSTSDPVTYTEQGTYTIHWTYDDSNGNKSTQTQTVVVEDTTAPDTPILADIIVGECSGTPPVPTTTDDGSGQINGTTNTTFPITAQGTTVVTWTFDDGNGNVTSAYQNIIVDDVTAPVADVAILPTITGECSASVSAAPTATDNCKGPITGTTEDPAEYTQQGSYTIHWKYDDGNGNTSTQAQTVVVKDLSAPVADVETLPTITGECSVLVTAPTASDNCKGPIVGTTEDPTEYTQQGSYTIHWIYDDGYGNTSSQSQIVVVDDVTAPETPLLADVTVGTCSGTPPAPTTTDNCLETVTGITTTVFPITQQGTTVVTWTFNDGNGNITSASQNVIVKDVTVPVPNIASLPTITGECSVTVTPPTASDNCGLTIVGTTEDALTYSEQGTYTIHWTYDDGNGNTSTQTQTVVVDDVTAPVADVQTLLTVTGECSATVSAPTATDNCEGTIKGTTTDPLIYSIQGTYTIVWTYDDENGNTSTQTQSVVVEDITPPEIPFLGDVIVGECSGTPEAPTTSDNCLETITGTTTTEFPITTQGITVVEWSFDDGHGNKTTAFQNIVVDDTTDPVADQQALPTVPGECSVSVLAPTATDNCEGIIVGTTEDPTTYSAQGTYTIHWLYDDGNGNTSTQTQTVVVDDITPPEMPILADVIVGECSGTPPTPTTVDNCAGIVTGKTSIIFPKTKQGKSTILWTFDDGNGNVTSAYQNLIVDDITAPVADQEALPIVTGECRVSVSAPTATDNCEGIVVGTTEDPTTYAILGTYIIHWIYDDGNGNTSTQTQTVVVEDNTPPEIPVLADVIVGQCSGTPESPITTDNCLGTVTGTTTTEFPITSQGTTVVTWRFMDGSGHVVTANQNVIVVDDTPPVITGTLTALTVEGCDIVNVTPPATTVAELEALGIRVSDACTADNELRVTSNDIHSGISPVAVTRTYIVTDPYGNSTTTSQSIVVVDSQKPTITLALPLANYPSDNGLCTYKVTGTQLDPLATSDNCSVKSVTNDFNNSSSLKEAVLPTGVTRVIWTVEDAGGNKASASYDIVVTDTQNPEIVCAEPSISYSSDPGVCTYKVPGTDLDPKVTTDNCSVKFVINDFNRAGSLKDAVLPIGTTKVTWTVEDVNGNKTTCISDIVVVDTQNPVIQCAEPTVDYTYQTPGTELDPIATDNCGVASLVNDFTNSASLQGAKFQPGTNVVKWTATDYSGNKTSCSITIEVADIQPPTINCAPVAANGYGADQGVCTYTVVGTVFDPAIEDNYSEVDIVNNFNHRASLNAAQLPLGETTVIWTATDKSGNSSTCTQVIKVNDTQKPAITAPASLTVKADAGKCTASGLALGTPVTSDNCSVASVNNDAPDIFALGQTVVTWTVTDKSGNMATSIQTIVVDRLPIAVDDAVSLKEDAQVSGNVMVNDAGLCNVPIQVKSHSEPAHGELTMADNGDFIYIPDENYHGTDRFTYRICGSQDECSEATVTITVESVNDLPIANEDKHTIQLDLVLQGDVADNDKLSGDGVNVWTVLDQPAHGTILFNPDGTYTYTPNADFLGSDSFTYKLCDADGDCSQAKVSILIEDVLLPNQILTPNGDGVNDTFIIVGINLYPQNKLTMYNRWGNVVYQKNNYQNEWDGNSNVSKIGSKSLPVGTYYYLIDYGKDRHKTGFVYLDR